MKVYVITRGEYSDYHICAVALTRADAEILVKKFSLEYDEAQIEEYDTSRFKDILRQKNHPYTVRLQGDLLTVTRIVRVDHDGDEVDDWDYMDSLNVYHHNVRYNYGYVQVSAPDEDTAKKIAIDLRAKYMAQKEGIT